MQYMGSPPCGSSFRFFVVVANGRFVSALSLDTSRHAVGELESSLHARPAIAVGSSDRTRTTSIEPPNYKKVIDCVGNLTHVFPLGPEQTRIALITYSSDAKVQLDMTHDGTAMAAVLQHLKTNKAVGWTHTDKALSLTVDVLDGARERRVSKVVLIITDGCTNKGSTDEEQNLDARKKAEEFADRLRRERSAIVFLVYVGGKENCTDNHMLNLVANDTSKFFNISGFDNLTTSIYESTKQTIPTVPACNFEPVSLFLYGMGGGSWGSGWSSTPPNPFSSTFNYAFLRKARTARHATVSGIGTNGRAPTARKDTSRTAKWTPARNTPTLGSTQRGAATAKAPSSATKSRKKLPVSADRPRETTTKMKPPHSRTIHRERKATEVEDDRFVNRGKKKEAM